MRYCDGYPRLSHDFILRPQVWRPEFNGGKDCWKASKANFDFFSPNRDVEITTASDAYLTSVSRVGVNGWGGGGVI